jgi:hypothetical protein
MTTDQVDDTLVSIGWKQLSDKEPTANQKAAMRRIVAAVVTAERKLAVDREEEVIAAYESGKSLISTARANGTTVWRVRAILEANGVPVREPRGGRRNG